MKKMKMKLGAVLMLGTMLSACNQVVDFQSKAEDEYGMLSLALKTKADFANTRAVMESAYENVEDYTIVV